VSGSAEHLEIDDEIVCSIWGHIAGFYPVIELTNLLEHKGRKTFENFRIGRRISHCC
jgi:hypothetical protein